MDEKYWLRRAIRHCEFWGKDTAENASFRAHLCRAESAGETGLSAYELARHAGDDRETAIMENSGIAAAWLPESVRYSGIDEMRSLLAQLESEAA